LNPVILSKEYYFVSAALSMTEIEIHWPEDAPVADMVTNIEACCSAINLTQTLRGTLGKYLGCTHWHYKNGKAKGVLEITLWPHQHRLWFVIHENRKADWIDDAASQLKATLRFSA
jgi:hypothetical protein